MAGYCAPPSAAPHDEPDAQKRASTKSGDAGDQRAFRSRLEGTGVYSTRGDVGSSSRVHAPEAIRPLVLGRNGKR